MTYNNFFKVYFIKNGTGTHYEYTDPFFRLFKNHQLSGVLVSLL